MRMSYQKYTINWLESQYNEARENADMLYALLLKAKKQEEESVRDTSSSGSEIILPEE